MILNPPEEAAMATLNQSDGIRSYSQTKESAMSTDTQLVQHLASNLSTTRLMSLCRPHPLFLLPPSESTKVERIVGADIFRDEQRLRSLAILALRQKLGRPHQPPTSPRFPSPTQARLDSTGKERFQDAQSLRSGKGQD